jgi:ketosteroid isomerase-like protein
LSQRDFDSAIEGYRQALQTFVKGDPTPAAEFWSRRDDVTLANPLGPPRRGWADVAKAMEEAAANLTDGSIAFEEVSRYATPDLGYVVQLERTEVQLVGSEDLTPLSLRVTVILRREGDIWTIAHRHADPITTARPISTAIEA